MANHVDGYLRIETNDAGKQVWQGIIDQLQESLEKQGIEYGEVHLAEIFFDDLDDPKLNREWMSDNIGAKWAYARDWDDESISMYSAWSPCGEFAEWVIKQIAAVDPEVTGRLEYQDEMPNFIGVAKYDLNGECDDECIEWDEIQEICMSENPELRELWDEENMDWKDEEAAYEILWDVKWDVVSEWCGNR